MTDYKEEQRNEIEALEAIYPEELIVITDDPFHVFSIDMKCQESVDDPSSTMVATLKFTYVPNYPDEPPLIEIASSENLEERDEADLLTFLEGQVEELLGMAMVFTLVSEASEWLNKRSLEVIKRRKEEEEKRVKFEEEEERKKFEGIRVTVESFLSWKAKFDLETSEVNKQQKDDVGVKKLTGRELFEKDRSLVDSDLQFLQEGDEGIKVDESLFQELDDLELQGEISDDADSS